MGFYCCMSTQNIMQCLTSTWKWECHFWAMRLADLIFNVDRHLFILVSMSVFDGKKRSVSFLWVLLTCMRHVALPSQMVKVGSFI